MGEQVWALKPEEVHEVRLVVEPGLPPSRFHMEHSGNTNLAQPDLTEFACGNESDDSIAERGAWSLLKKRNQWVQ